MADRISRTNIIKWSLWKGLESLFTDTNVFAVAKNVYGEDKFIDLSFRPVAPWVYILQSQLLFEFTHLPVVVVETWGTDRFGFELGDSQAYIINFALHVFAADRNQRDQLAGLIIENITGFDLLLPTDNSPALTENGDAMVAIVLPYPGEVLWATEYHTIGTDRETFEGSLTNWAILSSRVQTN